VRQACSSTSQLKFQKQTCHDGSAKAAFTDQRVGIHWRQREKFKYSFPVPLGGSGNVMEMFLAFGKGIVRLWLKELDAINDIS